MTDYDPRLVDLYDEDNPVRLDGDFYRALADDLDAGSVLDLGCGTGSMTVSFARTGRTVLGIDPSRTMLQYAMRRDGAASVRWELGDSRNIPDEQFDFAVMTGNVAQQILDPDWDRTLRDVRAQIRDGGTLAFESRNPAAQAWKAWRSAGRSSRGTMHGVLEEWMDVADPRDGIVDAAFYNRFVETDETIVETARFAFRDRETITKQLESAGFEVEAVYGDWQRAPFTADAELLIFVARARPDQA